MEQTKSKHPILYFSPIWRNTMVIYNWQNCCESLIRRAWRQNYLRKADTSSPLADRAYEPGIFKNVLQRGREIEKETMEDIERETAGYISLEAKTYIELEISNRKKENQED